MDLGEHILLNDPALTLTILKAAAHGTVSLEDCLRRLQQDLARAGETVPEIDLEGLLARMNAIRRELVEATLLEAVDADHFAATQRGHEILTANPEGVDESVLMSVPAFRDYIRRSVPSLVPDDPRAAGYDEGYAAYAEGLRLTDNPYPADTIDHLAWENGWFEAGDEETEHQAFR
jgi:restriction system protein